MNNWLSVIHFMISTRPRILIRASLRIFATPTLAGLRKIVPLPIRYHGSCVKIHQPAPYANTGRVWWWRVCVRVGRGRSPRVVAAVRFHDPRPRRHRAQPAVGQQALQQHLVPGARLPAGDPAHQGGGARTAATARGRMVAISQCRGTTRCVKPS